MENGKWGMGIVNSHSWDDRKLSSYLNSQFAILGIKMEQD